MYSAVVLLDIAMQALSFEQPAGLDAPAYAGRRAPGFTLTDPRNFDLWSSLS